MDGTNSDRQILKEISDFEIWYTRATWWWGKALFCLRTISILSGFAAALLTSLTVGHQTDQDSLKVAIIIFSSLGSLAATFLTQYRVSAIERLRADGRITSQKLRQKVEFILPTLSGIEREKFVEVIFQELNEMEAKQNDGFYTHFSGKEHRETSSP